MQIKRVLLPARFVAEHKMSLLTWLTGAKTRSRATEEDLIESEDTSVQTREQVPTGESGDKPAAPTSETSSDTGDVTPSTSGEIRGKKRKFCDRWLEDFPWCEMKVGKLFCKTCSEAVVSSGKQHKRLSVNKFVVGSTNLQRSALERHQNSDDHLLSKTILNQRAAMVQIQGAIAEKTTDSMKAQVHTAVTMAIEDIPYSKFSALLQLQKENGAQALQSEQSWYKRHDSVQEMQAAAAGVCKEKMLKRIQDSPFIGIILDESLDIAVQKKLVIYFKITVNGVPGVQFGTNIEVADGKSATIVSAARQYLQDSGIPLEKIAGIGTDGANVMVGCNNGVTTVMKRLSLRPLISVWCCAHRLSLIAHWAASAVPALKKIEDVLVSIFKFFKYSAVRYNQLKTMKKVMKEKVKRFKKPTSVRWLSLHEAVLAALDAWGCLVLLLENQAAAKDGDSSTLALSLLKNIKTYKFVASLCVLLDVLEPLTKCSKTFQKDVLNIDDCLTMLDSTFDLISSLPDHPGPHLTQLHASLDGHQKYQGISFQATAFQRGQTNEMSRAFVDNMNAEKAKRFPQGDMEPLKKLNKLLNPKLLPHQRDAMIAYGEDNLQSLTDTFPQIDADRAKRDYRFFKCLQNNCRELSLEEMCIKIIQNHSDQFPDYAVFTHINLVIPLTSVPCERGFSLQNSVMNANRNRMTTSTLNDKLLIISESRCPGFDKDNLVQEATQRFCSSAKRKK